MGEGPVGAHVLLADRHGLGDHRGGAGVEPADDPADGPRQVDRGRPGRSDALGLGAHERCREPFPLGSESGDGHAESAGDTERGRAADRQASDGVDHRVDIAYLDADDLVREASLVEKDGVVLAPLDRAHRPGS